MKAMLIVIKLTIGVKTILIDKENTMSNTVKAELYLQFGPGPYTLDQLPEIIKSMEGFVDQLHERYSDLWDGIEWHKRADEYRKKRDELKEELKRYENLKCYEDLKNCPHMNDVLCYSKNPCSKCIVNRNFEYKSEAKNYRRSLNKANKRIEELENELSEYACIEHAREFNRTIYLEDLNAIKETVDSLIAEFSPNIPTTKQENRNNGN